MDYYSNIPASKGSNKVDDSITSGDITADVAVSFAESARKDVHLNIEMGLFTESRKKISNMGLSRLISLKHDFVLQ